jgi:hypothetical protein
LAVYSYVFFGLLDCLTTAVALALGGHEGNPVAASLYARYGASALFAFKAIVVAVIIAVLCLLPRRVAVWTTTAFAAAVAFSVVGNMHAILHLG